MIVRSSKVSTKMYTALKKELWTKCFVAISRIFDYDRCPGSEDPTKLYGTKVKNKDRKKPVKRKCIKCRYCKVFTCYRVVRGILFTFHVCLVDDCMSIDKRKVVLNQEPRNTKTTSLQCVNVFTTCGLSVDVWFLVQTWVQMKMKMTKIVQEDELKWL